MRFLPLSKQGKEGMERNKEKSPCGGCGMTRNCINGLYCTKLMRYVEHAREKPCGN